MRKKKSLKYIQTSYSKGKAGEEKKKKDPKESASVSSHVTQCSMGETGVKKGFFVLLSIKEYLNYTANSSLVQ